MGKPYGGCSHILTGHLARTVLLASVCNLPLYFTQETIARGIKKMGADRTAPVVLGPVTWVHLARHADAQASEEATIALKNQYLDAILPVYAVSTWLHHSLCTVCRPALVPFCPVFVEYSRALASCTLALAFVVENSTRCYLLTWSPPAKVRVRTGLCIYFNVGSANRGLFRFMGYPRICAPLT